MADYKPFLIANYRTGVDTTIEPWLLPLDAFQLLINGFNHNGVVAKRAGMEFFGRLTISQTIITDITNANPGQVTVADATGLSNGTIFQIAYATGMTEVNGGTYTVTNLVGTTFDLYDSSGNPIDTTAFGVYTPSSAHLVLYSGFPVMGLKTFIDNNNQRVLIAMDTRRACVFNPNTDAFTPLNLPGAPPFSDYFTGNNEEFFATAAFGRTGSFATATFFMTNNVDNIHTYTTNGTTITPFIPDANPTGSAVTVDTCQFIFAIRQRLLLLNTVENGTRFAQRMRWSQAQNPNVWDQVTPGNGGFVDAPTSDYIVSAKALQDVILVEFTQSVWCIKPTADPALPFRWDKINDYRACDAPYATLGYDRFISSYGKRGIVAVNTVEVERIDDKIERFMIDEVNANFIQKMYSERNFSLRRSWTLYPESVDDVDDSGEEQENSNKALIRTEEEGAWSVYTVTNLSDDGVTQADMSCLGFGETTKDLAWEDFNGVVAPDNSWQDFGEENWQSFFTQANSEVFLGGDQEGRVFYLEKGGDDYGQPITFELVSSAWNPYKENGIQAQLGYVDFYVEADTDTQFLVEFFCDDIVNPYSSQLLDCLPNLGFIADIQNITQANPVNVTADSNGRETGDSIYLYNLKGMDELTGGPYTVTIVDDNNFTLDGIDGTSFSAYQSGGTVTEREFSNTKCWKRAYAGGKGYMHYMRITNTGTDDVLKFNAFMPWFRPCGSRMIG